MPPANERRRGSRSLDDLRLLGETILVVALTWVLLGWIFDRAITQADGTVQWVPYLRSSLAAGSRWTDHLYRFGVIGGSSMHDSAGTLPVVQVCAAFGLGATTTANLLIVFLQVSIAFFSVMLVRGTANTWFGRPLELRLVQRICVVWACAFAPWLGWRLAYGHENLVLGVLPLVACAGLIADARSRAPSPVALVFATFVVWNGLSGLGAQTLVYGAVFGGPIIVVLALDMRAAPRWGRAQLAVVAALLAGILLTLPRLAGMIAHVGGDDYARSGTLTYSYAVTGLRDWLASLPWTTGFADSSSSSPIHETNVPIGPFLLVLLALWPPRGARRLTSTIMISGLLAILFAANVGPIADVLLHALPPLASFRVPSRALIVVLVFIPPVALAACYARLAGAPSSRADALGLLVAVGTVAAGRFIPGIVREVLALAIAAFVIAAVRWRPLVAQHARIGAVAIVFASLGVAAFDERFPRGLPTDRIEDGPRTLHDQVVAELPELTMPLARIQIVHGPRPYEMSTAFAAGLSSLDGAWYPTRRFLALLSALTGKPIDSTVGIFQLTSSRAFPVLQQLYNVRYTLAFQGEGLALQALPPTPGAAWFPKRIDVIESGVDLARALGTGAKPSEVAWILRADLLSPPKACGAAQVLRVSVDPLGQTATIAVDSPDRCVLVVATNYVHSLHAMLGTSELAVFPIDLALTGIEVPTGRAEITLGPRAYLPWWSQIAFFLGLAVLAGSVVIAVERVRT